MATKQKLLTIEDLKTYLYNMADYFICNTVNSGNGTEKEAIEDALDYMGVEDEHRSQIKKILKGKF